MIDLILTAIVFYLSSLSAALIIGFVKWCDGDNGHTDNPGDVAETEDTTEIETTEESKPTNGGTQDDQPA